MKKKNFIILDVETTKHNGKNLVYDLGYLIRNNNGEILTEKNLIIEEVFSKKSWMDSAYYAEKLPQYYIDIENGIRDIVTLKKAKYILKNDIEKYLVKEVYAYNANFDRNALNSTIQWRTANYIDNFFPQDIKFFCIWNMACQVLCQKKKYRKYCIENNLISEKGNLKTSAETVFGFISQNPTFQEKHTGLEDCYIESEIFSKCLQQHKKMNRNINPHCWRLVPPLEKE